MRFDIRSSVLSVVLAGVLLAAVPAVAQPVEVTPDSNGWVCLPPVDAEYVALLVKMFHSLPDPSWKANVKHQRFINSCKQVQGGSLGGDVETFDSDVAVTVDRADGAATANEGLTVHIPVRSITHTSKQDPGARRQTLQTTMWNLEGRIENQGGWKYFAVTAGDENGLPSPGETTLTRLENGNVAVESFFKIRYRVEYIGAEDGPYAGLQGSGEGETMMRLQAAGGGG